MGNFTSCQGISGRRYLLALFLCGLWGYSAFGQGGGPYAITWSTIDSGGGTSRGGPYQLTGTVGQADAGYHYQAPYELLGGFWVGGPLCVVDLEDFAQLAAFWLDGPCDESNQWCSGADLNRQDDVNIVDLTLFVSHWLQVCPYGWPL